MPVLDLLGAVRRTAIALSESTPHGDRPPRHRETTLWRELCGCILGSQVRYPIALDAVQRLTQGELRQPWVLIHAGQRVLSIRQRFRNALRGRGESASYRFPNRGADLISRALTALYSEGPTLRQLLDEDIDPSVLRRLMVARIPGLGPKQASLFLTNLGHTADFAVIDRHILRFVGVLSPAHKNVAVNELSAYIAVESLLRLEAKSIGVTLATFDLAAWVVMRVAPSVGFTQ